MCGIVGFNFKSENNDFLSLAPHRGPDSSDYTYIGGYTLGHNRLAVVDHNEESNQPFYSECGKYVIVFNGEVYNHADLRKDLAGKYPFKTKSDTEAMLYAYIEYGDEFVHKLRGMFSFVIYNSVDDELFCARDRIGIKPLNYYFKDGKFIFASEINVIAKLLEEKPSINQEAIRQYMKYLYVPCPDTIFTDIKKLPPGHVMKLKDGELTSKPYWEASQFVGKNLGLSEGEILEELDYLFDDSVKTRMIADVELGSFLSGGIDSSLILYYMQKNSEKKINTYTLGFENADSYDESSDAMLMAKHFNTNHQEILIKPDVVSLLPKMVKHFGEPFASPTSLLIHELTKETKKFATVALAGDGGDEVFGGYPKYQGVQLAEKLNAVPKFVFNGIAKVTDLIPENTSGNHLPRRIKAFASSLGKDAAQRYDDWSAYISDEDLSKLFKDDIGFSSIVYDSWNSLDTGDGIITSSLVDLRTYLPNDMLYYGDIMSMANAFEVRFPLIDHNIVEFMTSIDSQWRIKNGQTKYLMKRLLQGKVPDQIIAKKKLGLNPPMGIWLKRDLAPLLEEYLSKSVIEKRGIFDYKYVQQIIDEFTTNRKDRSLNLWAMVVLEEWFRQYLD
ncbi:asparagine synthase (glutamine-hydrolyzing) [Pseudoalteromonas luteoviolacea]|uniref:asparagine synthase (glutamine-hydrolyzing) n=1 Tax=Pseudoalteromonas luteoviolacea TaxID=43657 RepID=A0A1C0TN16_9GAMM|nr:asparagine synthase (glutamine-hydrolyzing) [Pseudoalteromonas luteoviolacea]OCQ20171.1 asparagine synthase (glutamine-hydrolyzing) [Pseudoalteromonas luteoviolacea]